MDELSAKKIDKTIAELKNATSGYYQTVIADVNAIEGEFATISAESANDYNIFKDRLTVTINGNSYDIGLQSVDIMQSVCCMLTEIKRFAESQLPGYVEPRQYATELHKLLNMIIDQTAGDQPNSPDGVADTAQAEHAEWPIDDEVYDAIVSICDHFVTFKPEESDYPYYI